MGSDQRELLLEESQDTHCLKKSSFPCTLIWILVSMVVIALAVGLVILFMEQTVKPPFVDVDCGRVEGVYDARHNVRIFKVYFYKCFRAYLIHENALFEMPFI